MVRNMDNAKTQNVTRLLEQAISDYLIWMKSERYSRQSQQRYKCQLFRFADFVNYEKLDWNQIFTIDTLTSFQTYSGLKHMEAVRGLSGYLFKQEKIGAPIGKKDWRLPEPFASYIAYYKMTRDGGRIHIGNIHRILSALHHYLKNKKIEIGDITIIHIDGLLAEFNAPLAPGTRRIYRSCLRGFLTYLYQQTGILKKDLAPLVVGAPLYALDKPPKFLRPNEVKKLFDTAGLDTPVDLRTYAMLHLAFGLGLRPKEISLITLDDIRFTTAELTLRDRKNNLPATLPLSEEILKAITAYIVGGRPDCKHRVLFANHSTPHRPVRPNTVSRYIGRLMHKSNLCATAYWLRHTYAQNLLESGASIFEIKEMMGHDRIQSSKRYLHIHTKLMREVICDETF
jgi:integrase/recombinase XerD